MLCLFFDLNLSELHWVQLYTPGHSSLIETEETEQPWFLHICKGKKFNKCWSPAAMSLCSK